jgi:hypothetical protein
MLILSMLFAPFRPPRTRFSPSAPYAPYAKIQVVGDAKLKRACMAAQDVDVATVHSKTLPFFALGPGEKPWRSARCGLRCWKGYQRHG